MPPAGARSSAAVSSGPISTASAAVDRAGVEALLDRHQAHTGGGVAGQDGALDRRGAPPAGQQREVDVDQGQAIEHVLFDDAPEGHHHAQLGARGHHVLGLVTHGQAEFQRGRLDRAGTGRFVAAAPLVGPADDEGDVMTGLDEGSERHRGRLGRAEKCDAQT